MGLDPRKIPLIREAFGRFPSPLTDFSPDAIRVWLDEDEKCAADILPFEGRAFLPPRGWQGHCELSESGFSSGLRSTKPTFIGVTE